MQQLLNSFLNDPSTYSKTKTKTESWHKVFKWSGPATISIYKYSGS